MLRLYLTTMRTCCAAITSVVSCINCVCRLFNCSSPLHIAQRRLLPRLFHSDVSALCIVGVYGEAKERESEKRCEREGRRRFASFWVVRELMNIRNDATLTMVKKMRGMKMILSTTRTSDTHSAIWSSLLLCLDSAFAIEQRRTWTQLRCFNCSWSTCVSNWMAAGTDVRVSGSFMLAFALQREEKKRVLSEKLSYLSR